jgi:hypothetical protein
MDRYSRGSTYDMFNKRMDRYIRGSTNDMFNKRMDRYIRGSTYDTFNKIMDRYIRGYQPSTCSTREWTGISEVNLRLAQQENEQV